MTGTLVDTVVQALWLVLMLSAPPIVAAALVGLFVAIIQAATQLQEQTLQYALKFFVVVIALFVTGGLVATSLVTFSSNIFDSIGDMR